MIDPKTSIGGVPLPSAGRRGGLLAAAAIVLLAASLRLVFGSASAVASDIRTAYHLAPASIALLTTGPVVCLGLFGPLAALARRRWQAPLVLCVCLAVITVGTAARALAYWPALLTATLFAGAGIAVANVLGPVAIRMYFSHRIGPMTGVFTGLISASAGVASGATVPLIAGPLHNWRATLSAWAIPSFIATLTFAALAVRHGRVEHPGHWGSPSRRIHMTSLLRSPTAWAVTGFMGLQSLLAYSMIAWLPTLYQDRGLTPQAAGLTLTALSVASILTALTAPVIATRIADQRMLAIGAVAPSALGLVGITASGTHAALVWAVLLGFGQGAQLSLALTLVNLRARDIATAADLSTMTQSIGYLIAALGPIVIGAARSATTGWTAPMQLLLALTVPLAAAGWAAGRDRTITLTEPQLPIAPVDFANTIRSDPNPGVHSD